MRAEGDWKIHFNLRDNQHEMGSGNSKVGIHAVVAIVAVLSINACSAGSNFSSAEHALERDDVESFKKAVEAEGGLKVVARSGYTWLHKAAKFDSEACAAFLIENGADLNAPDLTGLTPMHVAVIQRSQKTFHLLRKSGANESALTNGGRSVKDYLRAENLPW